MTTTTKKTATDTTARMEKKTAETGRALDAINVDTLISRRFSVQECEEMLEDAKEDAAERYEAARQDEEAGKEHTPEPISAHSGELVNIALRRKARINVKGLDSDNRDWTAKGENKHWRWIDIGFLPCVAEMDENGEPTKRFVLALGSEMVTYSAPTKAMPVGTIRAAVHLDASDALDAAEPFYIGAVSNKAARQVLADISAEEKEEREAYEALARIQLKKQWNRHRLECLDKGCDEMSLEDFGAALVLKEAKAAAKAAAK